MQRSREQKDNSPPQQPPRKKTKLIGNNNEFDELDAKYSNNFNPDMYNPNVSRNDITKRTCTCEMYFPSQTWQKDHKRCCHPRRRN